MNENEVIAKLSKLEAKVDHHDSQLDKHDKRIEKVEDSNKILQRMEVILTQQVEMNKEQHITLSKMNENLSAMNISQFQMQEEMKTMNNRIEKVEQMQSEDKEKNTIDLRGLSKKTILKAVGIGVGVLASVITAWVLIQFGLK